jgi:hypothetical protein
LTSRLSSTVFSVWPRRDVQRPSSSERQQLRIRIRPLLRDEFGCVWLPIGAFEVADLATTLLILRATELPTPARGVQAATAMLFCSTPATPWQQRSSLFPQDRRCPLDPCQSAGRLPVRICRSDHRDGRRTHCSATLERDRQANCPDRPGPLGLSSIARPSRDRVRWGGHRCEMTGDESGL